MESLRRNTKSGVSTNDVCENNMLNAFILPESTFLTTCFLRRRNYGVRGRADPDIMFGVEEFPGDK